MMAPCFLRRQHAARGFLRPEENGVEIGAEHLAPFLGRHFDGTAAMGDAGIVDQDGDGAEGFFGGIEGARHGGAVGDVGCDGNGLAAVLFDFIFQRLKPLDAARHQRDGGAVVGQRARKLHAKAAGGAGDQRDAALQIEHGGGLHGSNLIHTQPSLMNRLGRSSRLFCAGKLASAEEFGEKTLAGDHQ